MTTLWRATLETPVGPMLALCSERALCALEFVSNARLSGLDRRLSRWFHGDQMIDEPSSGEPSPMLAHVRNRLTAYFDGASAEWSGVELDLRGTAFERRVWSALRTIPAGTTSSYGAVARAIGAPGAARAVGLANGANPLAIVVPCHRVIGADGSLTGYGGGLDRKKWLLSHERRYWNALPLWLTDDFLSPASANVQPKGG
jgi:O-6-methylguanine DNA methyltransferase